MAFSRHFLEAVAHVLNTLDEGMRQRKERLFALGVYGSAANVSSAVSGFREIAGPKAHAPADHVSGLTARTNDEVCSAGVGWEAAR